MNAVARALAGALVLLGVGCEDMRQFTGTWVGEVSRDPAHQIGFGEGARLRANIGTITRAQLDATLELPGTMRFVRFEPVRHAAGDILADMRLPGDPLRTYLGFVRPAEEPAYLAVVSLYPENRVQVRLIRGPDESYGVFTLCRDEPCERRDSRPSDP